MSGCYKCSAFSGEDVGIFTATLHAIVLGSSVILSFFPPLHAPWSLTETEALPLMLPCQILLHAETRVEGTERDRIAESIIIESYDRLGD